MKTLFLWQLSFVTICYEMSPVEIWFTGNMGCQVTITVMKRKQNKTCTQWILNSESYLCLFMSFLIFNVITELLGLKLTHTAWIPLYFNSEYIPAARGNPASVFKGTTVSESKSLAFSWLHHRLCWFWSRRVRHCAEFFLTDNVGVVSVLPDQCEIIHGLMHDHTRGTCV